MTLFFVYKFSKPSSQVVDASAIRGLKFLQGVVRGMLTRNKIEKQAHLQDVANMMLLREASKVQQAFDNKRLTQAAALTLQRHGRGMIVRKKDEQNMISDR